MTGWFGIFAPPGTPQPSPRSFATRRRRPSGPEVVETLAKQGMVPLGTQPAEYAKYMEQEFAIYSKIIKDANIKPPQ